jgi:hypothetical protein
MDININEIKLRAQIHPSIYSQLILDIGIETIHGERIPFSTLGLGHWTSTSKRANLNPSLQPTSSATYTL